MRSFFLNACTLLSLSLTNVEAFTTCPGPVAATKWQTTKSTALPMVFDPEMLTNASANVNLSMADDLNIVKSVDQNTILGGVGAAVASAVAFFTTRGGKKGTSSKTVGKKAAPEPEPIDVSIPYNAAAQLAYDEWRVANEKGASTPAGFAAFKTLYEEATVGKVTYKKMERDLAAFKASYEAIEKKLDSLDNA
jgi:hypothetical protein